MSISTFSPRAFALVITCTAFAGAAQLAARQGAAPAAPAAAPAPAQGQGQPGGGGGRGGGRGQTPAPYDDYTGFTKLWDGATLTNWDGESDVWSIQDGLLHADTVKTPGQHHIHYIGPNAVMKDFDLKVEFKISATGANGGIQYRSRMLHTAHGGTMADPMGKPTPAGITTQAQAVAAGLTAAGGGGGGGNRGGGAPGAPGGGGGNRGGGAPGAAPGGAAPAAPASGGNRGGGAPGGTIIGPIPTPSAATPSVPMGPRCGATGGPGATAGPAIPLTGGNIWQVSGYQFDLDANNQYTGQLYEGNGRSIVTAPGRFARLMPSGVPCDVSIINSNPAAAIKPHLGKDGEWQQVEIIARGNTLVHILNGQVMSVTIDDNPDFRALSGILSLQLEGSGQIWYRNVYVKHLN